MLKEIKTKIENFGRELKTINKEPYKSSINFIVKQNYT